MKHKASKIWFENLSDGSKNYWIKLAYSMSNIEKERKSSSRRIGDD